MVDNPSRPPAGWSLNDIQTRLAETSGQWLTNTGGKLSVRLMDLATVVHEIGTDIATRLVNREIGYRYHELAAAMRRSIPGGHPDVADALERWAASLERRGNILLTGERPGLGGEQR